MFNKFWEICLCKYVDIRSQLALLKKISHVFVCYLYTQEKKSLYDFRIANQNAISYFN